MLSEIDSDFLKKALASYKKWVETDPVAKDWIRDREIKDDFFSLHWGH